MLKQMLMCVALAIPGTLIMEFVTVPAASAADKDAKTHEGKVVSVSEGKLTMSDNDGKNEHSHVIAATTKITLDGRAAKLADLTKGDSVKVTTGADGKVTMVDAKRAAK